MYYAELKTCDIANGPGTRTSLFVSGCTHRCKGCFNKEAWDFQYGHPFTKEIQHEILDSLRPSYVHGLTLLGGEPMEPVNQQALLPFIRMVKIIYPQKSIWCYTGYTYERDLASPTGRARCEATDELLAAFDVLVDGEFIQELHDITLRFRGSSNQRLIDLAATRAAGEVRLWQGDPLFATHRFEPEPF